MKLLGTSGFLGFDLGIQLVASFASPSFDIIRNAGTSAFAWEIEIWAVLAPDTEIQGHRPLQQQSCMRKGAFPSPSPLRAHVGSGGEMDVVVAVVGALSRFSRRFSSALVLDCHFRRALAGQGRQDPAPQRCKPRTNQDGQGASARRRQDRSQGPSYLIRSEGQSFVMRCLMFGML